MMLHLCLVKANNRFSQPKLLRVATPKLPCPKHRLSLVHTKQLCEGPTHFTVVVVAHRYDDRFGGETGV